MNPARLLVLSFRVLLVLVDRLEKAQSVLPREQRIVGVHIAGTEPPESC
ncbi:MAG: hypothetical protein ACKO2L_21555 [Planctomycetaceae bacterium]